MHNLISEVEEERKTIPETTPPGVEMTVRKDVPIPMRDGLDLAGNVFRPVEAGKYPVIMAFSLGKDKPWSADNPGWGIASEPYSPTVTGTTTFEGNEPAFWVSHGYTVIFVDPRGAGRSPGTVDPNEWNLFARDIYDAVEWAGAQEWSNGNVGLSGVSYLGFTQWRSASLNPPHLKAINPWEAFTDLHRDTKKPGGIPEVGFNNRAEAGDSTVQSAWEPPKDENPPEPWDKEEDDFLEDITVPALICGTWGDHGYHTRGSFRAFRKISSEHKWLYTHGRQKWAEFYSSEARHYRKIFFDHFLKGTDDRILEMPTVRMEVRETLDDYSVRYEDDFPIPRTEYERLYLNGADETLRSDEITHESKVNYDSSEGKAIFEKTFDEDTELSGYMNLKLWAAPEDIQDMDLFATVRKLDTEGDEVHFDDCIALSRWPVAIGWLRLSHRELDEAKSTGYEPYPKSVISDGDKVEPGEVVPCEIPILPSSTLFREGETLQLIVSGQYQGGESPDHDWLEYNTLNEGTHSIHTGGDFDSSLLIPKIPSE